DTQWAPLSESLPVLYWAAQRIMKERATAVQSPGKAKHLLTRIMTCGVCGATLAQHRIKGRPRYHCSGIDAQGVATGRNGCVSVSQEHMDDYITNLVVHRLSQPDLLAQAAVQDDAVIVLAQAEAEALRAKLDEAYAGYKRDVLTLDQYAERKLDLMARIEAAEAAVRNLGIPPMLRAFTGLIGANNNTQAEALVREMWKGFPVAGRRDIIRALFSKLSLRAGVPGGQVFNPDRLERTWRKWSDALDE
ncbi:zinc ribbon domain-containing protein, partial [Glycomyces rutgersensis]